RLAAVQEGMEQALVSILEESARGVASPDNPEAKTLRRFWEACTSLERAGVPSSTVIPALPFLDGIDTAESLVFAVAQLHEAGFLALFSVSASSDPQGAPRSRLWASPGVLGLPIAADYADPARDDIRSAYAAHIRRLGDLAGVAFDAESILSIETR